MDRRWLLSVVQASALGAVVALAVGIPLAHRDHTVPVRPATPEQVTCWELQRALHNPRAVTTDTCGHTTPEKSP